ncbi:MAG: pyridoxal-phosphate dependent enzyme [Candidatus Bathyarchaeota archaeon]|nr:pyridoxal-phosphate dependent enzyme [Candidatus Bathyarchaeota archaeon]MDH5787111.1 pyridoxal-phosphate dependent enzyme [Candidatus Bathyarchaeota archaeon]
MEYEIKCSVCSRSSESLLDFKCGSCDRPLDVQLNLDFDIAKIRKKNHTAWRYVESFPYVTESEIVTLGEGWTPLVNFAGNVHFKLENLNPTGSFKDRGSAVLISALQTLMKKVEGYMAEDSSGNAGASVAAYAGRAESKARIYVPENVSGPKFSQIQFYGAEVIKVSGSRSEVADEAQKVEKGKYYVGHILHPLFRDGIRSLAYEMAEQLDWRVPERIYLPVSAGTLLLGVINGFKHLIDSNVTASMPKIVACQTRQVSPLYHKIKNLSYASPEKITSIADALVSVNPPLLDLMVKRLREVNGDAVMVEENDISKAFIELARNGFFVEPSSAVAYAAYKKQLENKELSTAEKTVVILTGTGLKKAIAPSQA